jgi:CO/xanthine dehydrogenase Mo-binding subunit
MAAPPAFRMIGKPVPRVEGYDKLTGRSLYTADVPLPGQLWARTVRSPLPHARIVSIDVARARQVPGVRAILTAADIPGRRSGRVLKDMPVLCPDVVRYIGDRVAVVAAETPEAANEAALLIAVEYDELPAVFDPIAAMAPGAPLVHPDARSYAGFSKSIPDVPNLCGHSIHVVGDLDAGFAAADLIVEHTFRTPLVHQGYLEPNSSAVLVDEAERVQVWASNKLPYTLREQLADVLDRPEGDIAIHPIVVGGDFGAKGSPMDVPAAYHLAHATGRPVRFVSTSQDDLIAMSHRHPLIATFRTGVKRDGRIVARDVRLVYNTGAYGALKPSENGMLSGGEYAGGPYKIPNLRIEGLAVYTNTPPSGYMRAPGHPQVAFAVEAHMELVARELGMDPYEFRRRNIVDAMPSGEPSFCASALAAAAQAIDWSAPKPAFVGRGMAIAERGIGNGEGASDLTLNPDGTVTIATAVPDQGSGTLTLITQIVAEELGLALDRVNLVRVTTDELPVDVGAAADRMTNVAGHAAIVGSRTLRDQLTPLASAMLGGGGAEWAGDGWRNQDGRHVTVEELALEMVPAGHTAGHVQVTVKQPASKNRSACAQAAEVEVDPETGKVTVRRIVSAQDTGTVINALGHQGQVEGAVIQGMGFALSEELVLDDGRVVNPNLGDYKLLTAQDVPELITVNIDSKGPGPYDAKAIGETPSVPVAGAIANAVADAIGGPILELPITAERVLAAISSVTRT